MNWENVVGDRLMYDKVSPRFVSPGEFIREPSGLLHIKNRYI